MDREKISVIVPVYNSEKYLERCINSLLNQTYRNLEIILIDDGSVDSSPVICDKYAAIDPRVIVIHQKNSGASAARNKGLDEASGNFIGFVDSDDFIEEDMYESLLILLRNNNADIARCAHRYIYDDGSTCECDEIVEDVITVSGTLDLLKSIGNKGNKSVVIWNKLYKKSVIGSVRFYTDLIIGEDTVFLYNVYKNADIMVCRDIPMYYYSTNDSQSFFARKDYNYQAFRSMQVIASDKECPTELFSKLFMFGTMTIHDIAINEFDLNINEVTSCLSGYKKQICKSLINNKNWKGLMKFFLLLFNKKAYMQVLKSIK